MVRKVPTLYRAANESILRSLVFREMKSIQFIIIKNVNFLVKYMFNIKVKNLISYIRRKVFIITKNKQIKFDKLKPARHKK